MSNLKEEILGKVTDARINNIIVKERPDLDEQVQIFNNTLEWVKLHEKEENKPFKIGDVQQIDVSLTYSEYKKIDKFFCLLPEITDKWISLGFAEGLEEGERRDCFIFACEQILSYLYYSDNVSKIFNDNGLGSMDCVIFPMLRRLLFHENDYFQIEDIDSFSCKKVIDILETIDIEKLYDVFHKVSMTFNYDYEASCIVCLCNIIIDVFNKK